MCRIWLLLLLGPGAAPPLVESVENAASHIPASLPGGGIPAGARAVIRGARFGADSSQVSVRAGAETARVLSVRDNQIEVLWPRSAGPLSVTVGANTSSPLPAGVNGGSAGLFAAAGPARRGGLLTLRGTGGVAAPSTRVFVGAGEAAIVSRRILAEGREEVVVRVPGDAPLSCSVPVTASGSNRLPGNTILVQVTESGQSCPSNAWEQLLAAKGSTGLLLLSRSVQAGSVVDDAVGVFLNRQAAFESPLPAPGTCALYRMADALSQQSALLPQLIGRLPDPVSEDGLDAGPRLVLSSGNQARSLNPRSPGFYTRTMGGAGEPAFLNPGTLRLAWPGGRQVPAFSLTLPAPEKFHARLPPAGSVVTRSGGLTLTWTAGAMPPLVVALLTAPDRYNRAMAACLCTAPASAGSLHMPAWLLQGLPPSSAAGLALTALPMQPITWKLPGLENAAALSVYVETSPLVLR